MRESQLRIAGGTTLIDLMKLDVMRPSHVIDINALSTDRSLAAIEVSANGLRLGALAAMAQAADHPDVIANYPGDRPVAAARRQRADSQHGVARRQCACSARAARISATRPIANCNKRNPGSGCAALDGVNRAHAVLGTSDAVHRHLSRRLRAGADRARCPGRDHRARTARAKSPSPNCIVQPGETPHVETTLLPGELITGFHNSGRAVGAPLAVSQDPRPRVLRIRAGRRRRSRSISTAARYATRASRSAASPPCRGAPTRPKQRLSGKALDDAALKRPREAAFAQAQPREHNAFKIELGKRTLVRALRQAAALEILT